MPGIEASTQSGESPEVRLEFGQKVTIIAPEAPPPPTSTTKPGEIPYPVIRELRGLVNMHGTDIVRSIHGDPMSEFGTTREEMARIKPVVTGLREAHASLPQVNGLIFEAINAQAVPGTSDEGMRKSDALKITLYLKTFADQVLGEPDEGEIPHD